MAFCNHSAWQASTRAWKAGPGCGSLRWRSSDAGSKPDIAVRMTVFDAGKLPFHSSGREIRNSATRRSANGWRNSSPSRLAFRSNRSRANETCPDVKPSECSKNGSCAASRIAWPLAMHLSATWVRRAKSSSIKLIDGSGGGLRIARANFRSASSGRGNIGTSPAPTRIRHEGTPNSLARHRASRIAVDQRRWRIRELR